MRSEFKVYDIYAIRNGSWLQPLDPIVPGTMLGSAPPHSFPSARGLVIGVVGDRVYVWWILK